MEAWDRAPYGSGWVGSTALPDPKHRVGSGNGSKRVRMGQTGLKFDKSVILEYLDKYRSNRNSKIIPIGAIFAEIAIFAKFQVGSGRVNCLTRPEFSGRVGSGTRISGQKCGALAWEEELFKEKTSETACVV